MNCRECDRPLWDGRYTQGICEGCSDRAAIHQTVQQIDFEAVYVGYRRPGGDVISKRLQDLARGY